MASNQQQNGDGAGTAVALAPTRLPLNAAIAKEFELDAATWRVLVDQIFPAAKTKEAVLMALSYCKSRNLDIMKRPVHIVPMWSTVQKRMVETVWPGIAEVRTTASRTKSYAGMDPIEFGPEKTETFKGVVEEWENNQRTGERPVSVAVTFPEYAVCTVYRVVGGERCAFSAKVFWKEACAREKSGLPNSMWQKRPYGQLDKCVEAAALRRAFPEELGNELTADEMHGRTIEHEDPLNLLADNSPRKGPPAAPPAPAAVTEPAKASEAPTEPANGQSGENAGKAVVDAEFTDEYDDDPESVFKDANEKLGLAADLEDIAEIWSGFEHHQGHMFPPDWDHLCSIKTRHEGRVQRAP